MLMSYVISEIWRNAVQLGVGLTLVVAAIYTAGAALDYLESPPLSGQAVSEGRAAEWSVPPVEPDRRAMGSLLFSATVFSKIAFLARWVGPAGFITVLVMTGMNGWQRWVLAGRPK